MFHTQLGPGLVGLLRFMTVAALCWLPSAAQTPPVPVQARAPFPDLNPRRILGIIPNYQTVSDPTARHVPLTVGQKWHLALMDTIDPFNLANVALGAGSSQWGNRTPKYGEGGEAYGERFGAAWADLATQNFFSAGVLACLLHQDPRYFRKGPGAGVLARVGYAVSRLAVTRNDDGRAAFNYSGVGGTVLGIAASNLYYPPDSVRGQVMLGRLTSSLSASVSSNLLSEFWPDIQKKFFHRRKHGAPAGTPAAPTATGD